MTRAAVFILLLLLRALAPVATVTAAVVYEEGENHQEGDDEGDGRHAGQDQQSLEESGKEDTTKNGLSPPRQAISEG